MTEITTIKEIDKDNSGEDFAGFDFGQEDLDNEIHNKDTHLINLEHSHHLTCHQ